MNEPIVLFEDNHLLVVNKPAGMLVQGDNTGDYCLKDWANDYLRVKYEKPGDAFVGVSHRIDRPVSGVVVLARTSKALARLNEMFKNQEAKKMYWAVVENLPDPLSGNLTHYIRRDEKENKSKAYNHEVRGSKLASLDYNLISSIERYHLLEIHLHTGRHHQIRCQLAKISCPIKGDVKYGAKRKNDDNNIHLHARKLSLLHPVKKEKMNFVAAIPEEKTWRLFKKS